MDPSRLLDSLRHAVEVIPDDDVLRAHLATLLVQSGARDEAVGHVGRLLAGDPGNVEYQALMRAAMRPSGRRTGPGTPASGAGTSGAGAPERRGAQAPGSTSVPGSGAGTGASAEAGAGAGAGASEGAVPGQPAVPARGTPASAGPAAQPPTGGRPGGSGGPASGFDWGAAERDLIGGLAHEPVSSQVRLADVGGLVAAKAQVEAAFLTPLRNPELRRRYGATLRGGLLLYGPPGCGKTYLARAIAGELGAGFIAVSLADVLSKWLGQSEGNVAAVFRYARAQAPCVLFFDELDALGRSRAGLGRSGSALRGVVNQLLTELDGVSSSNEGVFVLGATNAPWDVDVALRRPGRFDRTVFVEPPDDRARAQILGGHLADLPTDKTVNVARVAGRTDGFSGADLALACRTAGQLALAEAARTGDVTRPVTGADLDAAVAGIRPSTGQWFASARNVVLFADAAGEFTALAEYMRQRGML